ncbi:MAG: hypothetical protein JSR59_17600 [Proteobacteria bacterium]|nr:hypothetical protein [Pseudomonadota bacterium]
MNVRTKATSIAILLLTAGCAGSPYDIAKKHDALRDYQGVDSGFIVAGAGAVKDSRLSISGVTFRRRGTEELVSFGFKPKQPLLPGGSSVDFESAIAAGTIWVKRLPPGDYEIVSTTGTQFGRYEYNCSRPIPPIIIFTIKTGEVAYLGRYVSMSRWPVCGDVSISEDERADIATAKAHNPDLPVAVVRSFVPPAAQRKL